MAGPTPAERSTQRRARASLLACCSCVPAYQPTFQAASLGGCSPSEARFAWKHHPFTSGDAIFLWPRASSPYPQSQPSPAVDRGRSPGEPRRRPSRRFRRRCAVSPCAASASRARPASRHQPQGACPRPRTQTTLAQHGAPHGQDSLSASPRHCVAGSHADAIVKRPSWARRPKSTCRAAPTTTAIVQLPMAVPI